MGSGNMSQIETSAFHDHLDYRYGNISRLREQSEHATIQDVFENSVCCTVSSLMFYWETGLSFRLELLFSI